MRKQDVIAKARLRVELQYLIGRHMKDAGMTQHALAKKLGVSDARVSVMLSSSANPTIESLVRVFNVFGDRLTVNSEKYGAVP